MPDFLQDGQLIAKHMDLVTDIFQEAIDRELTAGETMLLFTDKLPVDDPIRVFQEWFHSNRGDWISACKELGIIAPEPGPHLFERLREAVTPILMERMSGPETTTETE